MYLLNNSQIQRYVMASRGTYLDIDNFDERMLQHTSYYFRLGNQWEIPGSSGPSQIARLSRANPTIALKPHGYVIVESFEIFSLSEKVMGLFGPVSGLVDRGLKLNHSHYIDPLYSGKLRLGLQNLRDEVNHVQLKEKIGKVSFFDISDTYPIRVVEGSISARTFEERKVPKRDDDPVHVFEDGET